MFHTAVEEDLLDLGCKPLTATERRLKCIEKSIIIRAVVLYT